MDFMKPYKQILVIELKDWTILNSEKTKEELKQYLDSCQTFADIDWVLFNKFEFKKAYEQKVEWPYAYVLTFTKDIQEKLKKREKEKKDKVGRGWDSIEEIENWLKENNLISSEK